jgi:uncharacterized protein YdiU (UPF0061 family)
LGEEFFSLIETQPLNNTFLIHKNQKDYTNSLRQLNDINTLSKENGFNDWLELYDKRITQEQSSNRIELVNSVNPKYILRNYLGEVAIRKAQDDKNYTEIDTLFNLLSQPFDEYQDLTAYADEAPSWAQDLKVSCSS